MTESLVRRGGCRLCLAPDSECVPIFATAAADKEPLSSKIQACVNIKIYQGDRLSSRVCHACISYLNSWQSFKNRCYAAQKKQRGMLDTFLAKERARIKSASQQQNPQQTPPSANSQRQIDSYRHQLEQQRILKDALSQPSGSSANKNAQNNIDVSFIKSEPVDDMQNETGVDDDEDVDPSQFLARDNDDGDELATEEEGGGGPPILTSLGLTHINHVNPYSFLSTELGNEVQSETETSGNATTFTLANFRRPGSQPCCTVCNMKFSNRANARRHERNIHGIKADILTSTPHAPIRPIQQMHTVMRPIMRPIMRTMQKKKKVIPPIVYDYTKPELYREFLTDSKLYFIKRHIDFLEQYQNMRCTCCNRDFPTYKTFMVHMRKRYDTLSRNLCFKCLKQFQSKALFVAHLKKKNCLNLYKVYCADDTVSKEPLPPIQTRVGTKEIIANKVYGCKLCSKTFRLKMDFRGHVYEAHGDVQKKETIGPECGFCKNVFEDASVRRRHYNNMECIVFLICGTCDEKFDNLSAYIDHVYAEHLKPNPDGSIPPMPTDAMSSSEFNSSNDQDPTSPSLQSYASLKYPQNCKVCGKQYNNYYNVLRHMESKHPFQLPDTYRCEPCDIGYPRQTELREHMFKMHGVTMPKIKRESFTCRICLMTFDNKDVWIEHQAVNHSQFYCSQCDMETESKEELEAHLETHTKLKMFTCTVCYHSFHTERGLETHLAVMHQMKKEDMPEANGTTKIEEGMDIDGEFNLNDDDDDEGALEIAADVHVNGETEGDFENGTFDDDYEDDDGNTADNDETIENPAKRMKLKVETEDPEIANLISCPLCPERFNGKIALSNHMRSHAAAMPQQLYGNAGKLNIVKRTGHVSNRMRCRICQKRIHTKIGFKRHMLVVHQVRDCVFIKCKICPAEFSNDKGLKVHMFRTHNVTVQQMQNDPSLRSTPNKESTTGSNLPKILPKIAPKLMFECDICHTVYRNHEQLSSHRSVVHGASTPALNNTNENLDVEDIQEPILPVPEAWWQCRYCDETFNASKKLTIHMNSHEEHDNTDNTCKDCGNVYCSRKSLWVHRHKKHPRLPNPSTCELCAKVFFDKTELYYHLKTHSNDDVYSQLQELHQELENDPTVKIENTQPSNYGGTEEDLNCHICGQRFHDKRVLSKHLRSHETDNSALHTMLDVDEENGSDYSYPSYQGQMVDGQFACDMCPKTFPLINALKVHRGWHFRSPDGRQVTDPTNIWQPDVPQSKFKRTKAANPPTCPYCNSTFASGNNLRRHIVEVHKRNEAKMMRENGTVSETVFIEKELECQLCAITFSNRPEWVDHKINHARTMKPSTTFEWGCEICGKVFTRKERLLAHMVIHLSGKDEGSVHSADQSEIGGENSRSSMSSQSHSQQSQESSSINQRIQQIHQQQLMKQQHPLATHSQNIKPEEQSE
ncbi:Zinc finger protein, partial [Pseudolycoriella hygida]